MKISSSEFKLRLSTLQQNCKKQGIDVFIISEEESIYYLTGLTYKSLERLFILVIKPVNISFIVPKMEFAHLKNVNHVDEIKYYWEYPAKEGERWQDVLFGSVSDCKTICVEAKAPFEIPEALKNTTSKIDISHLLEEQRWVKSDAEIALIKTAAKYCDMAIQKLNASCYYGMSELEVLAITKYIQRKIIIETDFDYLASNILMAVWPSRISHQPHGIPKIADLLKEGPHISLSSLRVNGYAAELERTFFTTKPTNEQKELFNLMLEGRKRSYDILKEGITGDAVDLAAKNFFIKEGLADKLMHRTGHGIGIGNHESPFVAEGDSTILKENMVISIEPGIYIEGVGGFRHSDTVLVTKNGYEILTNCPDKIEDLVFLKPNILSKLSGFIARKLYHIK